MYEELIKALRCCSRVDAKNTGCDDCPYEYCGSQCDGICKTAEQCITDLTDQLAALQTALSRVTAERDAAMAEIPHKCHTCKHKPQKYGTCGMGCEVDPLTIHHAERCKWEWRGVQEVE